MNSIISGQFSESDGKELYESCKPLRDVCNMMENEESRKFCNQYLDNWNNTKSTIMLLKMYDILDKAYYEANGAHPSKYIIINMLLKLTTHKNYNKLIETNMKEFVVK